MACPQSGQSRESERSRRSGTRAELRIRSSGETCPQRGAYDEPGGRQRQHRLLNPIGSGDFARLVMRDVREPVAGSSFEVLLESLQEAGAVRLHELHGGPLELAVG